MRKNRAGVQSAPMPAGRPDASGSPPTLEALCNLFATEVLITLAVMAKVLLVDDELTMLQIVSDLLRHGGHEVFPFTNSEDAIPALLAHTPDLVITDLYFKKNAADGLEILKHARELNPPAVVIVITGFGSVETAVGAMKQGAFDYLEKPFKMDEFILCVQRALTYKAALSETVSLRKQLKRKYQFSQIVGCAPRMLSVFKMVERIADTESTVLVLGESGTGKELVARALHFNSSRQFAPFIPVNCSALPENLLESELFGHRRGAFTGAINDKKGLFEAANGGTIFLDEVGSMTATLQSRLLRVLQEREVRRVGENTSIYIDVRVVAASNESLDKRIKEGTFREDLYYRLNVISIPLPSLRERKDDIPLLVKHFLNGKVSPHTGKPYQLTRHAMEILCAYDWPGNVRELENAVERAGVLCEDGLIRTSDLPPTILEKMNVALNSATDDGTTAPLPSLGAEAIYPLRTGEEDPGLASGRSITPGTGTASSATGGPIAQGPVASLKTFMRQQETSYLNRAIQECDGDKEKAALALGISLATLYRKLSDDERETAETN